MRKLYFVILIYLLSISCTKDNVPAKMKVVMKTQELILTQLKSDLFMISYLCNNTPKGNYNIIVDEKICGETYLFFNKTSCMDDNTEMKSHLFEAGEKFTYLQPMDSIGYNISWNDSIFKTDLFSYMNSTNDTSFFIKLKIPYESDERY
ncbi:MAG: hypothetical protein H0U27_03830 [Nitrosopumilus sp.]|nr:hypothetical protein [Nitrosopumilus sp.]